MTSHDPYDGRDPSRGKGIAHYYPTSAKNKNKGIIIDTSPLILSSSQFSLTTRSPPPPRQTSKPQTTNINHNTTHVSMCIPSSCTETPLRSSHSTDPHPLPPHINYDGTSGKDNDEFDREIVGDKSLKHQSEVFAYDRRRKEMIFPEGKGFVPKKVASKAINTVIKTKYKDEVISYGDIKKKDELRREWFDAFREEVGWLTQDEDTVMKNFDRKCSNQLSDKLRHARITNLRPNWIDEMSWASLQQYWSSNEFIQNSQMYKRNRAFGKRRLLHTSGSIPTFEHAQITGGQDHEGTQMKKLCQDKNLYLAQGINVEERSDYIILNDSEANEQKPILHNDHLLVPPGFENISRGIQEPQKNQQVHDSNNIKVGYICPAMIEAEFQGGFLISIKDGDSSRPPWRGIIYKPAASNQNNDAPSTGFGNSGAIA